jgi:hypothetical protein
MIEQNPLFPGTWRHLPLRFMPTRSGNSAWVTHHIGYASAR